jgi:tetratricopeptide (TPR) repeat protein
VLPADNVDALLEAGLKAYGNNDSETAARCWRRVLEMQPDNGQAKDFLITAGFELASPLAQVVDLGEARQQRAEDSDPRAALRARVERLVQERKLEAALDELDRARPRFPDDPSISRSVRLLRDRLVFEYAKTLGRLDDVPHLLASREAIAKLRPPPEELALVKLIDGIASLGDLVRGSQLGRFETFRTFVRFLERGWIQMRAATGTWNPRDFLPPEAIAKSRPSVPDASPSPVADVPASAPVIAPRTVVHEPAAPAASPSPAPLAAEDPFDVLFREATEAYLRRDYTRAIDLFSRCQALRPEDRRVQHNLQRLQSRRSP